MRESEERLVRIARTGRRFRRRLTVVSDESGFLAERRQLSLLLVESVEDNASLAGLLAEVAGYELEIVHARGLAEARMRARERLFDVYFCDFWLGGETVLPLLSELPVPGCPVVLLSHLDAEDIELIGRRAGAAGILDKADLSPTAVERVLDTVLSAVEKAPAAPPVPALDGWLKALLAVLQKVERSSAETIADDPEMLALVAEVAAEAADLKVGIAAVLYDLHNQAAHPAPPVRFDLVPHLAAAADRISERADAAVDFVAPNLPVIVECRPETLSDCLHGLVAEGLAMADAGRRMALLPGLKDGAFELRLVAGPGAADEPPGGPPSPHQALHAEVVRTRRELASAVAASTGGVFSVEENAAGAVARLALPLRAEHRQG